MQSAKRARLCETESPEQEQPQRADNLPSSDWRRWCRLCAKDDPSTNVSVFCKREGGVEAVDSSLATAVGKYFWVNIRENDALSQYICTECHTLVTWLSNFTERVNKVQSMFCLLQNSSVNPNKVRRQYGLLDQYRDHIIQEHQDERLSDMTIKILREESAMEDDEEEREELEYPEETEGLDLHEELDAMPAEEDGMQFEFADEGEMQIPFTQKQKEGSSENAEKKSKQVERDEVETEEKLTEIQRTLEKTGELDTTATEEEIDDSDLFKELKYKETDEEGESEEGEEEDEYEEGGKGECDSEEEVAEGEEEERESVGDDEENETKTVTAKGVGSRTKQPEQCTAKFPPKRARRGRPPKFTDILADQYRPDTDSDGSRNEAKYQCSVCGKNYKNPTSYRKHMLELHQTAPEIPDFKCHICSRIYPTERQLAIHQRTHLPLADKLDVPCPYCDRKFSKPAVMRQHISGMHHKMKPFICDECGRALKTLAALNEHKLVHTNDTPFECEVCHKAFKNKARLKVHSEVHAETSFMCTLCGLKLNTRRTLKMHMLVHSDNKRFKCDFCQAAFKRSKALKNHLILHTGMRPYKCNFCGKTFSNGSNCRAHKKKTHPKELAEEEAQGKKSETVTVPKLEDLRTSKIVVQNPRKVQRHAGGLSLNMRALLIAAEERAKRTQEGRKLSRQHTLETEKDAEADTDSQVHGGMQFIEGTVGLDEATEVVEIDEVAEYEDEDEEEETIIYEIIDEI